MHPTRGILVAGDWLETDRASVSIEEYGSAAEAYCQYRWYCIPAFIQCMRILQIVMWAPAWNHEF